MSIEQRVRWGVRLDCFVAIFPICIWIVSEMLNLYLLGCWEIFCWGAQNSFLPLLCQLNCSTVKSVVGLNSRPDKRLRQQNNFAATAKAYHDVSWRKTTLPWHRNSHWEKQHLSGRTLTAGLAQVAMLNILNSRDPSTLTCKFKNTVCDGCSTVVL